MFAQCSDVLGQLITKIQGFSLAAQFRGCFLSKVSSPHIGIFIAVFSKNNEYSFSLKGIMQGALNT